MGGVLWTVSIAAATQSDFVDTIEIPAGTDGFYGFSIAPLDLTGTTAVLEVLDATTFAVLQTYSVTLTVDVEGDVPVTTFATPFPKAGLLAPGVYAWRLQVTWPFTPTFTLQYGHGSYYIREV